MARPLYIDRRFDSPQQLCEVLGEHYWHRAPVVFRNHGLGEIFGSSSDILHGLRAMPGPDGPPRIYADGVRMDQAAQHYCTPADTSVRAYVDRLSREHEAAQVLVVTDDFERTNANIWFGCARLCSALFGAVGFPVGDAKVNVFAGTYSRTPFRFHKDVADSLSYVLSGHKRYLIWDYETVAQHLPLPRDARHENIRYDHYDYTQLMHCATVVDTQPGDLLYWPWDCFHLAEPRDAEFSVTISFGIAPFAAPCSQIDTVAKRGAYAMRSEPFVPGEQPEVVQGRAEAIRCALRDEEVREALDEQLLFRRTRFGFKRPLPPAAGATFDDDDQLISPLPNLIAFKPHAGGLLVSVNGHGFSTDEHPGLVSLLAELNRGEPLVVGDLRRRWCDTELLEPDELDQVLACLLQFRAFEHQPSHTASTRSATVPLPSDLFERSGLFPLRLVDDGASVLMAPITDEQHQRIEGFETKAVRVPVDQLLELFDAHPPAVTDRRYVFTAGYSGSTLLCRCIDAMPGCFSLYEPRVLSDWSLHYGALHTGEQRRGSRRVLELLDALLFRSHDGAARVVVKVGPHVQEVMEQVVELGVKGVHLYTSLPTLLASTLKSAERRRDLRAGACAPQRAAMVERIGARGADPATLSDAQAIAYVWLTDLALYRWLRGRRPADALRALDFDRWLSDPVGGVRALADHLDLHLPVGLEHQLAQGDIFSRHSKQGQRRPFDREAREASIVGQLQAHRREVDDALAWAQDWWGGTLPTQLGDELLDTAPARHHQRPPLRDPAGPPALGPLMRG